MRGITIAKSKRQEQRSADRGESFISANESFPVATIRHHRRRIMRAKIVSHRGCWNLPLNLPFRRRRLPSGEGLCLGNCAYGKVRVIMLGFWLEKITKSQSWMVDN